MACYQNLKDYLKFNNPDVISQGIQDCIKSSSDVEFRIGNIIILTQSGIAFMPFDSVTFSIGVSCEIFYADKNSVGIYYFNMMLSGDMSERFSDLSVLAVEECTQETLITETLMSMFGLPDITVDNLEEEADKIHSRLYAFVKKDEEHKYRFNPVKIKEKYKRSDNMHIWPADLDQDILGQIRFEESSATIYDIADPYMPYPDSPIPANTILLNVKYFRNEIGCDDIITAAHELVHWAIHRDYMKLLQFLDDEYKVMECKSAPIILDDDMSPKEKARWYAEWQANELAIRVAIPKHLVEEAIDEYENSISDIHNVINSSVLHDGLYYQNLIYKLSWDFNVPVEIMKKRLRQLGYDYADGTFLTVDECLYEPFTFANGTLKENETFIVDRGSYERLLRENDEFAELINSGRYIYLGYVVCMLSAEYVSAVFNVDDVKFKLSDYAREHAHECLIKFKYKNIANTNYSYSYQVTSYLNKMPDYNEVVPESFELCKEDNELDSVTKEMINNFNDEQNQLHDDQKKTFANTVIYHMREKGIDDKKLAKDTRLKPAAIRKILSGETKNPDLRNVMAIGIALQLSLAEIYDMFMKLPIKYNIMEDTPQNRAYRFIIENQYSDLDECNKILRHFKQDELPYHKCNCEKNRNEKLEVSF